MEVKEWTFNEIEGGFDNHVRGQLPWYDLVSDAIQHMAKNFITSHSQVYDIGSSTGNMVAKLNRLVKERDADITAIECNHEMCVQLEERFNQPNNTHISLYEGDALDFCYEPFNLAILNLTLMFVDHEERDYLIKRLIQQCKPNGAIIIVDKFEPQDGFYSTIFNRLLWSFKQENNSLDDIIKKELSLQGIQIPMKRKQLACFREWFRFGDFSGYIYIK
jgi:tRNA (cmo5U34)-methyltransferase